ncbi:MAG: hypothetical protein D6791_17035 [Chloroflexi bacterium]|nr:MAG: hypothetical protein D6791_17035 [Chloroflexota bacterium]
MTAASDGLSELERFAIEPHARYEDTGDNADDTAIQPKLSAVPATMIVSGYVWKKRIGAGMYDI